MKKLFTIFAAFIVTASMFAQAPQKISYQAVIRNNNSVLVSSKTVGIKVSILQGTSDGTPVYVETQTPTSNANGLISIEIGGGSIVSGTFDAINWAADSYFIKTETDPTGGSSYTITGTSQLLSTPYALFSKTAGALTPNISSSPIIQLFPSGTSNPDRMIIAHSASYPNWGLQYQDGPDKMNFLSGGANVMTVNLGNRKIGIGTNSPAATLDILGGNYDLSSGEGDFRIGNSDYRLKMGIALGGGGAGDASIMQQGQVDGYNVLSLGAQGSKILFLNGNTKSAGIGTDNPSGTLEIKSAGGVPQLNINQSDANNYGRIRIKNLNTETNTRFWDIAGYISNTTAADDRLNFYSYGNGDLLGLAGNGAIYISGNAGTAGQVLQSNGTGAAPTWVNVSSGSSDSHYIGEFYCGGTVFYVYDGGKHGLIAATTDQGTQVLWAPPLTPVPNAMRDGIGAGLLNNEHITSSVRSILGYAAQICSEYQSGGFGDWYLPSKYELNLMYLQKNNLFGLTNNKYWSSTEISSVSAWAQDFSDGSQVSNIKLDLIYIRAIRAF